MCLLFDDVSTFYLRPNYYLDPLSERWAREKDDPFFAKSPAEKDLITEKYSKTFNDFIIENKELIDTSVLKPIVVNQRPPDWVSFEENEKKLLADVTGIKFGIWGEEVGIIPQGKIYIDSPWFSVYRWQSISGALHFAVLNGLIPFSDNINLSKLAIETVTRLYDFKYKPSIKELSNAMAFKSLSFFIPEFPALRPAEILEARDRLKDELIHFKSEMKNITTNEGIESYDQLDEIIKEKIRPRIEDIKLKIKSINNDLFRKIAGMVFASGGVSSVLAQFVNLPIEAQIGVASAVVGRIAT